MTDGKKKKKHVVYAINEEGDVKIYGPYSRSKANKVLDDVYEDDSWDKVHAAVAKLRTFTPQED